MDRGLAGVRLIGARQLTGAGFLIWRQELKRGVPGSRELVSEPGFLEMPLRMKHEMTCARCHCSRCYEQFDGTSSAARRCGGPAKHGDGGHHRLIHSSHRQRNTSHAQVVSAEVLHQSGYNSLQRVLGDLSAPAASRVLRCAASTSAIYGSDALAGVVNIILKKSYRGGVTRLLARKTAGPARGRACRTAAHASVM
jgi:hypothetical protein